MWHEIILLNIQITVAIIAFLKSFRIPKEQLGFGVWLSVLLTSPEQRHTEPIKVPTPTAVGELAYSATQAGTVFFFPDKSLTGSSFSICFVDGEIHSVVVSSFYRNVIIQMYQLYGVAENKIIPQLK